MSITIYIFIAQESIYELEWQFGELVKGVWEDLQYNEENISKLRVMMQFQLPQ